MNEDLARAYAFARGLLRRTSTEVVPFPGGDGVPGREFPLRYDSNLLCDRRSRRRARRALDRGGGSRPRRARVSRTATSCSTTPRRPSAWRWASSSTATRGPRSSLMVHRAGARAPPRLVPVEEVTFAEVRALIVEDAIRREPWATAERSCGSSPTTAGSSSEVGARFFVARVDGEPAGVLRAVRRGRRGAGGGRGHARRSSGAGDSRSAVVLRAVAEARAAGATWCSCGPTPTTGRSTGTRRLGFRCRRPLVGSSAARHVLTAGGAGDALGANPRTGV